MDDVLALACLLLENWLLDLRGFGSDLGLSRGSAASKPCTAGMLGRMMKVHVFARGVTRSVANELLMILLNLAGSCRHIGESNE